MFRSMTRNTKSINDGLKYTQSISASRLERSNETLANRWLNMYEYEPKEIDASQVRQWRKNNRHGLYDTTVNSINDKKSNKK